MKIAKDDFPWDAKMMGLPLTSFTDIKEEDRFVFNVNKQLWIEIISVSFLGGNSIWRYYMHKGQLDIGGFVDTYVGL